MSLVNMYLHKFTNPKINEYDTLSSEDKWNEYYDVILANPPFFSPKGGIMPHNRFGVKSTKAEVLFVDYINEHLKPKGRAGIIIPEGVIFQTGIAYKQLRKKLIETSLIGVVSLPAGTFNPYSGVKTSILILDKSNKNIEKIFFADVKNDGYSLGAQRNSINKNDLPIIASYLKDYSKIKNNEHITFVDKKEIINNDNFNLSLNHYSKSEIKSHYKIVKLKDVLKDKPVYGSGASKTDYDKKVRYLRITDINEYGYLKSNNIVSPSKIEKEYFLNFNDILFARSGSVGRCYLHKELNGNYQFAGYLIKFPLNEELINPNYLFYISKSNFYSEWIENIKKQGTISNINAKEYSSFEFPLPSLETQNQIVEELDGYQKIIDGCRQVIENYKPSIDIDPSWEMIELGQLCSLMTGGTPKTDNKEFYENGDVPWLVSGDIHKVEIYNSKKFITKKGMESSSAKFLPVNSVLIALNGQGKTRGTVAVLRMKATCNQSIVSIKPNDEDILKTEFLYLYLNSIYKNIRNLTGDNQRSGLNMPIIREIKIPLAPIEEQIKFINIWNSEKNMINVNSKTIDDFQKKIQSKIEKIWSN
jgi:type I restriction enzyme M protein